MPAKNAGATSTTATDERLFVAAVQPKTQRTLLPRGSFFVKKTGFGPCLVPNISRRHHKFTRQTYALLPIPANRFCSLSCRLMSAIFCS